MIALSVAVPRVVPPSLNVTVPVGVPPLAPTTVAVNVTDWPEFIKTSDAHKETVLLICCTASLTAAEVLLRF